MAAGGCGLGLRPVRLATGWDVSEPGGNKMPHRYFRQKLLQATVLRREMRLCLRVLLYDHGANQWDDVAPGLTDRSMRVGWPAEEVEFERPSLFSQFQEQGIRVQAGNFLIKFTQGAPSIGRVHAVSLSVEAVVHCQEGLFCG